MIWNSKNRYAKVSLMDGERKLSPVQKKKVYKVLCRNI